MRVATASVAGSPARANEDFVGVLPTAVVLLDGAGLSGIESICRHGVAWYVSRLGGELVSALSLDRGQDLATLLGEAIERVADAHRGTCDLTNPSSPSATVALLRLRDGRADYLVLGDSLLVLEPAAGAPLVVEDRREVMISRPYRAALESAVEGGDDYQQIRSEFIDVLRANRNRPGGFWVAKDDPRATSAARTGSCPLSELASAVLLSNGASRIVDRFGLTDWPGLVALLGSDGPSEVIHRVRQEERDIVSDDATIAHCSHLDGA